MALSAILIAAALVSPSHLSADSARGPDGVVVACTAPAPAPGTAVSGPVLQVIDGQTICIAEGPVPSAWLKVTLIGASERGDGSDLMDAVFARRVTCTVAERRDDGVLALCSLHVTAANAGDQDDFEKLPTLAAAQCVKPDQ